MEVMPLTALLPHSGNSGYEALGARNDHGGLGPGGDVVRCGTVCERDAPARMAFCLFAGLV